MSVSAHKAHIAAITILAVITVAIVGRTVLHSSKVKKATVRQVVIDMRRFKVGTTLGVYTDGSVVDMSKAAKEPRADLLLVVTVDGKYGQLVIPIPPTGGAKPNPTTVTNADGRVTNISAQVHTDTLIEEPH